MKNKNFPPFHPQLKYGSVGVLLVNLGTPQNTDYWSLRRYLAEFLSDRRVIEMSWWRWQPILQLFILTSRPQKIAPAYKTIWMTETDESPLLYFTRQQAQKLTQRFVHNSRIKIDWAMRYGVPSIRERILCLREEGCDHILGFALYPQYSAATTATVYDHMMRTLMNIRWQPTLRTASPFYDDGLYIDLLCASVRNFQTTLDWQPEVLLISFHGLPLSYFFQGDPYYCHCMKTGRLIREQLGLDETTCRVTFQSRFGRKAWLQPYTDETLIRLAQEGIKRLVMMTPGFIADCLETLEEIAIQGREIFLKHGGTHYAVIPCLNDSDGCIDLLERVVRRELSGWIDP